MRCYCVSDDYVSGKGFNVTFKFSQKSLNRLNGVHPDLIKVMKEAIKISQIDFGISQGVRTKQEQQALFDQGRKTPGKIVTNTLDSKHLPQKDGYGHAVDIACYLNGNITWSEKYYFEVADCVIECARKLNVPILWGGNFNGSFRDYPHYEITTRERAGIA